MNPSSSPQQQEPDLGRKMAIQRAPESPWPWACPSERRERSQVHALLALSQKEGEEEERALEHGLRTGWEEAVQGWGKAAPFACLQFQKQAKKSRASETVNSCIVCLDMRQATDKSVNQEPKTTGEQSKFECKLNTCDIISEKKEGPVHSSESTNCSATDSTKRESCNGKLRSLPTCQGEKKSLPLKEHSIGHPEEVVKPEALNHKAVKTPEPTISAPDSIESENLKSLLVLPPVKDATPKDSRDPSLKKGKAVISQTNQKRPSAASAESASNSKGTKAIEEKGDKETNRIIHDTVKEKKNHEPSPFVPRLPKTSFLPGGTEQVKDWGKDAPFTCYQVQKKSKKPERKEIVSYLPPIDIVPVTKRELAQAIKFTKDQSKRNYKLTMPAIGDTVSGKEKVPACCNNFFNAPMTDGTKGERNNGKLHLIQPFQGEKSTKNLQRNKYNKRQPEKLTNRTMEGEGMRLPHLSHGNPQARLRCMTLKILQVVLPPKEAVPCLHLESYSKKRKAIPTQGNKRSLNAGSTETASYIKTLKQSKRLKSGLLTI